MEMKTFRQTSQYPLRRTRVLVGVVIAYQKGWGAQDPIPAATPSTFQDLHAPVCECPCPKNGNKPFPNPSERLQRHLSVQYSREERHSNKPQVNCVFTFFPLTKSSSLLLSKLLFSFHVVFWAIPCCLFFFFPICTNEKPELLVSRTLNSWKIFCHCCSTRTRLGTMWKTS